MIKKRTEYKLVYGHSTESMGHQMTIYGMDGWVPLMPIMDGHTGFHCPMVRETKISTDNLSELITGDWKEAGKNEDHDHEEFDKITAKRYEVSVATVNKIVSMYEIVLQARRNAEK